MKIRKLTLAFLRGIVFTVALNLVPAATLWADKADESPSLSRADLQSTYGQLPMSFEVNQGQADPRVQFLSRGHGHQLFLTSSEAVLALGTGEAKGTPPSASQSVVRMTFEGANPHAELVGLEKLPGIVNYFLGSDSSKWHTNIPTYKKVEYKNVYTGIDVAYYGNQGQLEYDLIVAPGADPNLIRLVFDGAKTVKVDPGTGDLTLTLSASSTNPELKSDAEFAPTLRFQKPVAYQLGEHGDKHFLASRYVLMPSETSSLTAPVAFQVAAYDASKPLIIDPVLSWATYLGGSGNDGSQSIAVDTTGNAYVTGSTTTSGSGFTGTAGSSFQSIHAGGTWDAYVTKINAAGTALVYSTYLGGTGQDLGLGIAVDAAGQVYVTGYTDTVGFPGTAGSSIQSIHAGGTWDAYVTKINAAGSAIVYSTYLGGSGNDQGWGIAVDTANNAYVTGFTNSSSGFPGITGSSIQGTFGGSGGSGGNYGDAFVTKLNAAGTALVYSTYLGGSNDDAGYANGIAVDLAGNAYVTGFTYTPGSGFPGTASSLIQSTNGGGGNNDAFVTKLNAAGTAIVYSTYLGGSGGEASYGVAVDQVGQAYVTGSTTTPGSGFPGTAGSSIQNTHGGGGQDAFVAKLNAAGTALVYSTYLGGSGSEDGSGIAVDQAGNAYVSGSTYTPGSGFPGTAGSSIQTTNAGGQDAYVAKLNAAGTALVYSTYLGGSGNDTGNSIALDQAGNAYVSGTTTTSGSGFPGTAGSLIQSTNAGDHDAFVVKIVEPISYTLVGFFNPVDNNPVVNILQAGQGVPVKWQLFDSSGAPVSDPSSFISLTSSQVVCGAFSSTNTDTIEQTTGSSGLQYLGNGNWQYNWKTPKSYAGQCRLMQVNLKDGSAYSANFSFKK